jgi:hypothetical protein
MASGGRGQAEHTNSVSQVGCFTEIFLIEQENTEGDLPTYTCRFGFKEHVSTLSWLQKICGPQKEIFLEVFAADFQNFGYKWPNPDSK